MAYLLRCRKNKISKKPNFNKTDKNIKNRRNTIVDIHASLIKGSLQKTQAPDSDKILI